MHLASCLPIKGLWFPCDLYVGLSVSRGRLLHVPSILSGSYPVSKAPDERKRGYVRIEAWFLLHLCIIIDLRRL